MFGFVKNVIVGYIESLGKNMKKNQKISKSLKKHHIRKRRRKELKIIIWVIIFGTFFLGWGEYFASPVVASAPYERMNTMLPESADKKDLTCKEQLQIEAQKACFKHNLGTYCIDDLMGIAYTETTVFDCDANGDFGASHGPMQIHLGYHKHISQDQARDPNFAINWALDRMLHYKYPEYRSYAIMKHNGTPGTTKTLAYLNKVNYYVNK